MNRVIVLFIVSLVARHVAVALDPLVSRAMAEALVREAIASLHEDGRNAKIHVER